MRQQVSYGDSTMRQISLNVEHPYSGQDANYSGTSPGISLDMPGPVVYFNMGGDEDHLRSNRKQSQSERKQDELSNKMLSEQLEKHMKENMQVLSGLRDSLASKFQSLERRLDKMESRQPWHREMKSFSHLPIADEAPDATDRKPRAKPSPSFTLPWEDMFPLTSPSDRIAETVPNSTAEIRPARTLLARYLDTVFGICEPDFRAGRLGSRLISPESNFHSGAVLVCAGLLVYSAFAVPLQLSFWNSDNACYVYPTLLFDVAVDACFVLDILYHFVLGTYLADGRYCDSLPHVAWAYVTSPSQFFFDVITSVPTSWIDLAILQQCGDSCSMQRSELCPPGDDPNTTDRTIRLTRVLKPVRLVRLLRMLKLLKITSLIEDTLGIKTLVMRSAKIVFLMAITIHLFACMYWRVKNESNSPPEIEIWLTSKNVDPDNISQIYVLCFYFVFTVFATVGFGDVFAMNTIERLFCIGMFAVTACLFGTLLSEMQEIVQTANKYERRLDNHMEGYSSFFSDYRVPRSISAQVRKWIRFQFTHQQNEMRKKEVLYDVSLPLHLRYGLANCLEAGLFSLVPLVQSIDDPIIKADFASELMVSMEPMYFSACSLIASSKVPADKVMIVTLGRVEVRKPSSDVGRGDQIFILSKGMAFGDCCVYGDPRWAGSYGINADFVAADNCVVACIHAEDIKEILSKRQFLEVRKIVTRVAFNFQSNRPDLEDESEDANDDGPVTDISANSAVATLYWIYLARRVLHRKLGQVNHHKTSGRPGRRRQRSSVFESGPAFLRRVTQDPSQGGAHPGPSEQPPASRVVLNEGGVGLGELWRPARPEMFEGSIGFFERPGAESFRLASPGVHSRPPSGEGPRVPGEGVALRSGSNGNGHDRYLS